MTDSNVMEILLVTTRQTKRWIIPKGWPIKGLKPAKSAAREAFEEAGVIGSIRTRKIGSFIYDKRLDDGGAVISCEVTVFPLRVKRQRKVWPEFHQRICRWFEVSKASVAVEDGLRPLIESFGKPRKPKRKK